MLGPGARAWADRIRAGYPEADSAGLARLATRRFVRRAGVGGASAATAGLFAPVAELAAALWTQADLVLHLAAAHGRDPAHPDRAVELLVLTRVHPDADAARTALTAARTAIKPFSEAGIKPPHEAVDEPQHEAKPQPWSELVEGARRLAAPLAAQDGGWWAVRLAARLLPGAAVLAAAAGDSAAAQRLAARATASYRHAGRETTQSQSNHSRGSSA
ncbi:hypothetical protein [Micromonospora yangpuensis]|uniref:hypothetical protein n=1 Tax=Micromonospora yangpuensis TaxID=683228 RepID=UPI000A6529DD|nr:hypothetical protein [Micromonospora yangpuensis]GGL99856.1 hypothetical protein GCM10012279_16670 [Micromonospora yangpuensis]